MQQAISYISSCSNANTCSTLSPPYYHPAAITSIPTITTSPPAATTTTAPTRTDNPTIDHHTTALMSLLATQHRDLLSQLNGNNSSHYDYQQQQQQHQHQQQAAAAATASADILGNPHLLSSNIAVVVDERRPTPPDGSSTSSSLSLLGNISASTMAHRRFSLSHSGVAEMDKFDQVLDHLLVSNAIAGIAAAHVAVHRNNNNNNININNKRERSSAAAAAGRRFSLSMGLDDGEASDHFPTLSLQDLDRFDLSTRSIGAIPNQSSSHHPHHPINNIMNMNNIVSINENTKNFILQDFSINKLDKLDISESIRILKKRRLSSCFGMLAATGASSSTYLDDASKQQQHSRRDSWYSFSNSFHNNNNQQQHMNNYSLRGTTKDRNLAVDLKSILLADESMRYHDHDLLPLATTTAAIAAAAAVTHPTATSKLLKKSSPPPDVVVAKTTDVRDEPATNDIDTSSLLGCDNNRNNSNTAAYADIILKDNNMVVGFYEAFANSMMESQKSQQYIHDWDKKMGLKRSHSKTMRLSMRTRKKLRSIMKREIHSMK